MSIRDWWGDAVHPHTGHRIAHNGSRDRRAKSCRASDRWPGTVPSVRFRVPFDQHSSRPTVFEIGEQRINRPRPTNPFWSADPTSRPDPTKTVWSDTPITRPDQPIYKAGLVGSDDRWSGRYFVIRFGRVISQAHLQEFRSITLIDPNGLRTHWTNEQDRSGGGTACPGGTVPPGLVG